MKKIRIGSRDSLLAVVQAELIAGAIARAHPEIEIEIVTMKTAGDMNMAPFDRLSVPGLKGGAKGLFVKELEQALVDGRVDLAVHSLKDVPMEQDERLPIVALGRRGDPRDALVLPSGSDAAGDGPAGCSSARRRIQLQRLMPGRGVEPIRGNITTRLKKLDEGQYAFLVLAAAGLIRLGLEDRIARFFSPDEIVPAAGQGILACQGRSGEAYDFLDAVRDPDAEDCARAERAFVKYLGGGWTLPAAAYAEVRGAELSLTGLYADEAKAVFRKGTLSGRRGDAARLGETLARRLHWGADGEVPR